MRRFLVLVFVVTGLVRTAYAQTIHQDLIGLGMSPEIADYIANNVVAGGAVLSNNTYFKGRNAANSADISILKVDAADDTILNADSGDIIEFAVGGTTVLTIDSTTLLTGTDDVLITAGTDDVVVTGTDDVVIQTQGSGDIITLAGGGTGVDLTVSDTAVSVAGELVLTADILNVATNVETVAGAGTTVADAAALSATKGFHQLTGANGTVGWKFPSATAGDVHFLLNTTAGVPKVYAVSGGTCNGGAADAACTLVTGIVAHICYATSATAWICS